MDEDQKNDESDEQPEDNEELPQEELDKVVGGVNTFGIGSFTNGHCRN